MIIGIDLGTTNTCVSIFKNEESVIIPIDGKQTMQSIVSFNDKLDYVVGKTSSDYPYCIRHIKRIIGKSFHELKVETDTTLPKYIVDKDDKPFIKIKDTLFSPQQISSFILAYVKQQCEDYTNEECANVVITVPAYFNNKQRYATQKACHLANLKVIRIINEPTSASLSYYMSLQKNETILVYDMGGGTLDVSLLDIDDDVIDVLATSGNTHLGGADIDKVILDYIQSESKVRDKQNALEQCSSLKHILNKKLYTICRFSERPVIITQRKMHQLIQKTLMHAMKEPIHNVLRDTNKEHSDIDSVVFIGGSTKNTFIKNEIMKMFPKSKKHDSIDPDVTVAMGASIQSHLMHKDNKDKCLLLDVTPFSLGVAGSKGEMIRLINRNETLPVSVTKTFTTTKDMQDKIDVQVFQGEYYYVSECHPLGHFTLDHISQTQKYMTKIDITFHLDVNGVLTIVAQEYNTDNTSTLVLQM